MIGMIQKDRHFYKKLITIGLPIAFQNFITSSLNMVDVFMISSIGDAAVAGVGGANKLYFLLQLFLFGTSSGTGIFAAQYWGKKDFTNLKRALGLCLTIALAGGILFSLFAILLPKQVMVLFAKESPAAITEGIKYLRIIGFSYCFTAISFGYIFVLRGMNYVKIPMMVTILCIGVNTFLNWVLIYGNLGVQPLGVKGAAYATLIARSLETSLLIGSVYYFKLPISGRISSYFNYGKEYVRRYLTTVAPVIGNEVMWSLGIATYSYVYGRMSETVVATMTLTQTIEQLFMVWFFGMSSACAVMLGNDIGKEKLERAFSYGKKFIKVGIVVAVAMSILVIAVSGSVVSLFNVSEQVKYFTRLTLITFSLYIPFKVVNLLLIVGVLRSGGDTTFTMFLDMGGVWIIGVPLAFISGLILRLDIQYVYAFVLFEEVVKLVFAVKRMYSRKWLNNLV